MDLTAHLKCLEVNGCSKDNEQEKLEAPGKLQYRGGY